jgi:hypothetical protein
MLPNLLVIGGLKCGTTSLHYYLDQHPEISMSRRKELHYFSRPDWRERRAWYERQFAPMTTPVRGEATPHYTWYPWKRDVALRIHRLCPDARLIYVVRDPLRRLVSHAVQLYSQGNRRPMSELLAEPGWEGNLLVCASRYATQLEQYLEHFPADQILVIDQDDLRVQRRETLRQAFEFLGVDESFDCPRFDEEQNTRAEKRALTRLGLPLWNRVLGPAARRLPEPAREGARGRLLRTLSRPITSEPAIDPRVRPRLEALFRDETDRLREMTGKGFASWSV